MTGFPDNSDSKESTCECRIHGFDPWVRKIPWKRKWQSPPVFLPGKSHGQRNLVHCSPWCPKESDMSEWVSTVSDGWTPRNWSPNSWFSYICKAFCILVPNYPSNFINDCSTTETPWISLTSCSFQNTYAFISPCLCSCYSSFTCHSHPLRPMSICLRPIAFLIHQGPCQIFLRSNSISSIKTFIILN